MASLAQGLPENCTRSRNVTPGLVWCQSDALTLCENLVQYDMKDPSYLGSCQPLQSDLSHLDPWPVQNLCSSHTFCPPNVLCCLAPPLLCSQTDTSQKGPWYPLWNPVTAPIHSQSPVCSPLPTHHPLGSEPFECTSVFPSPLVLNPQHSAWHTAAAQEQTGCSPP